MGIFDQIAPQMRAFSEDAMPDRVLFEVPGPLVPDGKGGGSHAVLTTRGPFIARIRPIGSPAEQTFADQLEIQTGEVLTVPREVDIGYKERATYTYAEGSTFRIEVAGPMPRSSYGPHRKAIVRRLRDDE